MDRKTFIKRSIEAAFVSSGAHRFPRPIVCKRTPDGFSAVLVGDDVYLSKLDDYGNIVLNTFKWSDTTVFGDCKDKR